MFHMAAPGRRKNHGINRRIIKRLRPGRKSFALTLFALMFSEVDPISWTGGRLN
jgi:hypothetical protein